VAWAEPDQVRHQLERGTARLELVAVAHLAVPVPVGRVGELQRDRDSTLGNEMLGHIRCDYGYPRGFVAGLGGRIRRNY
jgi:hypothetical protein